MALFPILEGKAVNLSPVSMILAVDFSENPFIKWRKIFSISSLLEVFIMSEY